MSYEEFELEGLTQYSCDSCTVLVEALREAQQQCRLAEDERSVVLTASGGGLHAGHEQGDDFRARLRKLERLRDCAMEVLLKHQRFEHM